MRFSRVFVLAGIVLALSGCASEPVPDVSPPTSAASTYAAPAAGLSELSGTTWEGFDSEGSEVRMVFNPSGVATIDTGGAQRSAPNDRWVVDSDTLTVVAHLGGDLGTVTYSAAFDSSDGTIAMTYSASHGQSGTLQLAQVL